MVKPASPHVVFQRARNSNTNVGMASPWRSSVTENDRRQRRGDEEQHEPVPAMTGGDASKVQRVTATRSPIRPSDNEVTPRPARASVIHGENGAPRYGYAMSIPSVGEREHVLDLVNAEMDKQLAGQRGAGEALDTKATFVVGFIVVAVQVFLGRPRSEPYAGIALVLYAIAFLAGLQGARPRTYRTAPKGAAMLAYYWNQIDAGDESAENLREYVLTKTVDAKAKAIRQNIEPHRRKVCWWWVAVVAFGLAVAISTVSVLEAPSGTRRQQQGQPAATTSTTS